METALEELRSLLHVIPDLELEDPLLRQCLNRALIPDSAGVLPGKAEYTPSYDVAYAAYLLVDALSSQPMVTTASSEGTSVTTTTPDWDSLKRFLSSMSTILTTGGAFTVLSVPDPLDIRRNDMSGRGASYEDIDTDVG